MIRTLSIVGLLFSFLFVGLASAQEEEELSSVYVRTGPYAGVGGSINIPNFANEDEGHAFWATEWRAGYRLHRLFAAQMEGAYYSDFAGYEKDDPVENAKGDAFSITATGKFYPEYFRGRIQPNVLAGVGILSADLVGVGRRTEFLGRVGGGFDFWLNEHAILFTEAVFMLPGGSLADLRYIPVQLGFLWHFD